jgi:hypothetical protein
VVFGIEFPTLRPDHNDATARRQFLDLEGPDITGPLEALTWQYWSREEASAESPSG